MDEPAQEGGAHLEDLALQHAKRLAVFAVEGANSPVMEAARITHAVNKIKRLEADRTSVEVWQLIRHFDPRGHARHEQGLRSRFAVLACSLVDPANPNSETAPALRKLLEAMDAALRL